MNIDTSLSDPIIEPKAGLNSNVSDYIGTFLGGIPILASGLASSIPLLA